MDNDVVLCETCGHYEEPNTDINLMHPDTWGLGLPTGTPVNVVYFDCMSVDNLDDKMIVLDDCDAMELDNVHFLDCYSDIDSELTKQVLVQDQSREKHMPGH